jgi:hypothetical protein
MAHLIAVDQENAGVGRLAKDGGAGRDGLQHRSDVGCGRAHDTQHLANGRLLLQRLAEPLTF